METWIYTFEEESTYCHVRPGNKGGDDLLGVSMNFHTDLLKWQEDTLGTSFQNKEPGV